MKLLVGVGIACVLMLGVVVWQVWGPWTSRSSAAGSHSKTQLVRTSVSDAGGGTIGNAAAGAPAGHGMPTDLRQPTSSPAVATAPPSADADVHWPQEPTQTEALRCLDAARAALRDDPDHERALRDELAALAELGRWPEAAQTLARLRRLRPDDLDVGFDYAAVLLRLHRSVEAVALLNEVVARQPEHARAWFNLAVAHQSLGHLEEARRAWDRALALQPTSPAYVQRGTVLLDLHEWAAAAADFETVLQQQPDAADATLNLALALWRLNRPDDARARLRHLLDAQPQHVPALNRLAEIDWAAYEVAPADNAPLRDEALDCWRRSLAADPTQSDVQARLTEAGAPPP
jgi:tetratricopeptide (TPR) repeat protein